MSTRQYIGARYVPRFVGIYDNTQAYDALDVVDNGSGTTYIARIPTPPNTPLTNTTHWLVYGSSSGAILDLQGRVSVIEGDIPVIKSSILSIGGQVDTNTGDISALDTRLDDAEDDIAELDATIKHANRRVVFISDSYGTHSATNWAARVAQYWNLSSDNKFIFAEGSIGFAATNGSGTNFLVLLQRNLSLITNRDTITDIIVGGGTNDFFYWTNVSDLDAAITNFITYCKTNFPNARITCVFMGYDARMDGNMREKYRATMRMYGTQFIKKGCRFINAYQTMHYYFCREDFEHPNETGNELLACTVLAGMEGSSLDIYHNSTLSTARQTVAPITLDSAFTPGATAQIEEHIDGDNVLISLQIYGATLSGPAWSVGSNKVIGTWDSDIIPLPDRQVLQMPAVVKINNQLFATNLTFEKDSSDPTRKTNKVSIRWCPANFNSVTTFDVIFMPASYPLIEW